LPRIAGTILVATVLAFSGCKRHSTQTQSEPAKEKEKAAEPAHAPSVKADREKKSAERIVYAVWYDVPINSLAKRRAGKDELTAAHNRLPLGTMVRVTHIANGKSVIVRITDRGITDRHSTIDLCKEAAKQLDMLGEGSARVRIEVLPDDKVPNAVPNSKATTAQP